VDAIVENWKEFDLPFIKERRFKGLRFWNLSHRSGPFAPKKGIDNL
jgi:hypothetical protein